MAVGQRQNRAWGAWGCAVAPRIAGDCRLVPGPVNERNEKRPAGDTCWPLSWLVGAAGFELATLCSQSRCATGLRYAPNLQRERLFSKRFREDQAHFQKLYNELCFLVSGHVSGLPRP